MKTLSRSNMNYIQNQILFLGFNKEKWIEVVCDANSAFYEIVKDDAIQLFKKSGNYVSEFYDESELYSLAVVDTISQFSKNLTKKKEWLIPVCDDNKIIYNKLKSRLVNNMRNLFDVKRRGNVLSLKYDLIAEYEINEALYNSNIDIADLEKVAYTEPLTYKQNLKNLYPTLDLEDFERLCKIGDFKVQDVLGFNLEEHFPLKIELKQNGNKQSYIDLEVL